MHVNDIPDLDKQGLKHFALTLSVSVIVFFGILLPWLFNFNYPLWPWVLAGIISFWGYIAPGSLRPVYIGWMIIGLCINKVVTPVIMGVIYFSLFIPMGFILRKTGKITMDKGFDKNLTTYRKMSQVKKKNKLEKPF